MEEALIVAGDGRPRIFFVKGNLVMPDPHLAQKHEAQCTEDEFTCYAYPNPKSARATDERPMDKWNHGIDCGRYALLHAEGIYDGPIAFDNPETQEW